jgi:hypothetical protein
VSSSLADLVLRREFRHHRHAGRVLDELLPKECPVDGWDAALAWSKLQREQEEQRAVGVADGLAFDRLARAFARTVSASRARPAHERIWSIIGTPPSALLRSKRLLGSSL